MESIELTGKENLPDPVFRPGYIIGIFREDALPAESSKMAFGRFAVHGQDYVLMETSGLEMNDAALVDKIRAAGMRIMNQYEPGKAPNALTFGVFMPRQE